MSPNTMKQWIIDQPDQNMGGMHLTEVSLPPVGIHDVLVKFEAAALNYRDCAIAKGTFPFAHKYPIIPVSDGAGVVVETGSHVKEFKKGDSVITVFNQGHQHGDITPYAASTGVGGTIDGCFRQFGVFDETGLLERNALYGLKPIKAGQYVLVQGTGGVSVSALQLAKAAGAKVIATTSSDEKSKKLQELGADHVVNYRTTPNWGEVARQLTPDQAGVDYIMDIGGTDTLEQSLKCIKMDGIITLIGFLGASDQAQPGLLEALSHICTVRGVYVGSRAMLKDMVQAFEVNNIRPVLDSNVFKLEQGKEAFEYLAAQRHIGKVVVQID
ncbi:zinc-binding oxidoreductase [Aspergillus steynii IBT 23096]|uniref:Zinc-binding oxidoreductase n=1 Tax=Aspergillus steynii IBT 23096 TaxID=1392250 RepID=A0A2I2FUA0_9EURO|nr:zinc-binding oxidoreductase [Aspergillus steynii IBT 23096]PLB44219.1 zinc-binding oxidoreductase [Aspergillus steynii IBT 23096]